MFLQFTESSKTSSGPAVIVPVHENGSASRSGAALPDFNDEDDAVLSMCAYNDGDDLLLASSLDDAANSEQMTLS